MFYATINGSPPPTKSKETRQTSGSFRQDV